MKKKLKRFDERKIRLHPKEGNYTKKEIRKIVKQRFELMKSKKVDKCH